MSIDNLKTAVQFAQLSYREYLTVAKLYAVKESNILKDCITDPIYIYDEVSDAQLYLFETENTMFIAIRGTNSLQDVFHDLNADLVAINIGKERCRVHEGALTQFDALFSNDEMEEVIKKLQQNNKTICFASHSLGAMIAALFVVNICDIFADRIEVFGFGCPRVGDKQFVNIYNKLIKQSINIKNGCDPLTKLMVGSSYCPLPSLNYGRIDLFPKFFLFQDLPDHDIKNYVKVVLQNDSPNKINPWQTFVIKAQDFLPF